MSLDQQLTALISQVAMLSCLVGLIRTGRWRASYAFAAYVVAILTLGPLTTWVGGYFRTWGYWSLKQTVYQGLVLAFAAEMAWRICHAHPRACTMAGRWAIAGLLLCGGALIVQPWHSGLVTEIGELHGRAVIAALFLLTSTLGVAAHYRLRVEHFHSLLMVGFAFYLALFGALLRMMLVSGPAVAHPYWRAIDPPAYALFSCWLAFVAWNRNGAAIAARRVA
jgi:hypothetical protein